VQAARRSELHRESFLRLLETIEARREYLMVMVIRGGCGGDGA
jgi:hypothetical protein